MEFERLQVGLMEIDPRVQGGVDCFEAHVEVGDQVTAREFLAGNRAERVFPIAVQVEAARAEGRDFRGGFLGLRHACLVEPFERREQVILVRRVFGRADLLRGVTRCFVAEYGIALRSMPRSRRSTRTTR